jgi:hypothetical protein
VRDSAILTLADAARIDHDQSKSCINKEQSRKGCDTFDKSLHHAASRQLTGVQTGGEPVESVYRLSARQ